MPEKTTNDLSDFPLAEYRFHFTAQTDFLLPPYTGSAWRGLFGHALKRTVCVTHEKHCENCLLWQQCVYSYIFETPPPATTTMMRKSKTAPHPFIIRPDPQQAQTVKAGDSLFIDMVLIGRANQQLPYIIHAMQQIGKRGIGFQRGKFALTFIEQYTKQGRQTIYYAGERLTALPATAIDIPPLPKSSVTLHFVTPFRSVQRKNVIIEANFSFAALFTPLMRRLLLLSYFHTDYLFQPDFNQLIEQAKKLTLEKKALYWQDWQRYSSRQKTTMSLGGLMGSIELATADLQPFWSMLILGQYVHVGKVTVMGLGRYTLEYEKE
ncbi:MAG TPA: CRISPR system precrRNA processing endoribonuclease RAMP protein Cas6 [Thiothrix sp.]|nr:CRISPR system precrRNA processing endoribonuclease RAMP protein Cas6 [Thiothrix sp.]